MDGHFGPSPIQTLQAWMEAEYTSRKRTTTQIRMRRQTRLDLSARLYVETHPVSDDPLFLGVGGELPPPFWVSAIADTCTGAYVPISEDESCPLHAAALDFADGAVLGVMLVVHPTDAV